MDGTWTGAGADNNWLNADNWVDGVIPGDWRSAFFSSGVVNGNVTNDAYIGHHAITVDAGCTKDIVINGPQSVPQQGAPITVTGANLTFNTDLRAWSDQNYVVADGRTLTFNGRISWENDTPTFARVTINGNGAGTVVMARTDFYTGGTTVNGCTLKTAAANGAGSGAMTVGSGATWENGTACQTVAGLSGAGHVTRTNTGGMVSTGTDGAAQISADKNYVLKLDFEPGGGEGATVNGVTFTAAGLSGVGSSGVGWSLSGTTLTFTGAAGATGYALLLRNFYYNGNPAVLTFSNLTVGKTYEAVIFSDPAWGNRVEDATFTNGTDSHQLLNTNPVDYGYYAYTFRATDSTATITMAPHDTGFTFHWYGATLEEKSPLTVGDANDYLFSGVIDGDTSLVKQGIGVQTLAGTNPYAGGTTVKAGTLRTTAAGAVGSGEVAIASGATWEIRTGAHQTVEGLSGAGTIAAYSVGAVSTGADGASRISVDRNYLQLLDFGNGAGATVNGVTFSNASTTSGTGWTLGGTTDNYSDDNGSDYNQLMSDFLYGGHPGVLAFHNLTVGTCYDAVIYTQVNYWGGRWQNATFANGPDSIQLLNTDPGDYGYYSYQFEAKAETATIAMAPINSGNTFHWFAASLDELAVNTFTNGVTLTLGDAQDHRFEGAINGNIALVKQGSGTQTLAGPVAYIGSTTVNEGTLKLALPSAPAGEGDGCQRVVRDARHLGQRHVGLQSDRRDVDLRRRLRHCRSGHVVGGRQCGSGRLLCRLYSDQRHPFSDGHDTG